MPKVYVKFNSAVIKEVPLSKDEITIGRKPTNDIVIDHPTISGFHAKIKKRKRALRRRRFEQHEWHLH